MFGRKPKIVDTKLDEIITRISEEMDSVGLYSPEYPKLIGHLQKIIPLQKSEDKKRVSPDTMALVIGNIAVVLVIVVYENKHVFVSKAFAFLKKP